MLKKRLIFFQNLNTCGSVFLLPPRPDENVDSSTLRKLVFSPPPFLGINQGYNFVDYCAVFLLSAGDFYTRAFFFTPKHAENVLWFFTKKNRGKKTAQKQHMLLQKKSFLGHF